MMITVEDSSGNEKPSNLSRINPVRSMHGSYTFHSLEGVDSSSKAEFDVLWEKGLIMDETVVIHGTGMDQSQFNKMGTTMQDWFGHHSQT